MCAVVRVSTGRVCLRLLVGSCLLIFARASRHPQTNRTHTHARILHFQPVRTARPHTSPRTTAVLRQPMATVYLSSRAHARCCVLLLRSAVFEGRSHIDTRTRLHSCTRSHSHTKRCRFISFARSLTLSVTYICTHTLPRLHIPTATQAHTHAHPLSAPARACTKGHTFLSQAQHIPFCRSRGPRTPAATAGRLLNPPRRKHRGHARYMDMHAISSCLCLNVCVPMSPAVLRCSGTLGSSTESSTHALSFTHDGTIMNRVPMLTHPHIDHHRGRAPCVHEAEAIHAQASASH